jgi:xylulose-5-phosphate/fructose-6-phosphate phosphoketolase
MAVLVWSRTRISKGPTARSKRLFTQFSFPGGIPSQVAPETPGSIHEGGELGYALSHAYGAAFDYPNLMVACVVGDGEAETGPLATSWHSNKFLNPATDGVVLPILHLNGYKIANRCVLARISHEELDHLFRGYGYTPYFVEGDEPEKMHELMAATLDKVVFEIERNKSDARRDGFKERPRWPMIVLRTPKGWTCPKGIDGKRTQDYWRSHQVPMGEMHQNPAHVRILEEWMKSYRPAELFDGGGRLRSELADLAPRGTRRMSANPHTNGGLLLRELRLPNFRDYAVDVTAPGAVMAESTRVMGRFLRDVMKLTWRREISGSSVPTRTTRTAGRMHSRSPIVPGLRTPMPGTTISRPTDGSWRCSASTNARVGSRAIS